MRVALLGVRGSTPAPGADFVRYGGHTSCVALIANGASVPSLVLDAGTGLRGLPALLAGAAFEGSIVLTHLHWDHVQGLPFCPSVDNPESLVRLSLPRSAGDGSPRDALARCMSPPSFPIGPEGLQGSWEFLYAEPGPVSARGWAVTVAAVPHKGGETHGIRVERDGTTLAYIPDHALTSLADDGGDAARELASGVDVLLHGGQFVDTEIETARAYGHSTIEAAMALADRCGAGRLVLTHHAPGRTDEQLDAFAARFTKTPGGRPVAFAQQDDVLAV